MAGIQIADQANVLRKTLAPVSELHQCSACKGTFERCKFSKNQRKKPTSVRRCKVCIAASQGGGVICQKKRFSGGAPLRENQNKRRKLSPEEQAVKDAEIAERQKQEAARRAAREKKEAETEAEKEAKLQKYLAEEKEAYEKASFEPGRWEVIKRAFGDSKASWKFIAFGVRAECDGIELTDDFVSIAEEHRPTMTTAVDEAKGTFTMEIVDAESGHFLAMKTEATKPDGASFRESRDSETVYGNTYYSFEHEMDGHDPRTTPRPGDDARNGWPHLKVLAWHVIHDGLAAELAAMLGRREDDVERYTK